MFGVSYDTWKSICNMYFSLNAGSQKAYLQWFPFTKLSSADKENISGEEFYNSYIKTASFMLFPPAMHQSENYLQKGDGSFRDSSLVAPVLFLFLQSIGLEVHNHYSPIRPSDISVYYAGNYEYLRPKYKQDYDDFFKELNASIDEYQYFIKTDITNFFANISVDRLISQIDKVCNSGTVVFSQTQLHLFKELLTYCGNGRFPLIENSVASSYLATVVYLDAVDKALHEYISKNITAFSSFRIVRYVDDMSEEHYPARNTGNEDVVAVDLGKMFDTFTSESVHAEIREKLNHGETLENITGDIFDTQLSTSLFPKGRTARTLCRKCNTFLGKYDEAYLRFFNLDGTPKSINGFQQHTKYQIIKAIYAKFLSIPEAAGEAFDFIDFIRDDDSTVYNGNWNIYFVKRDFSSDLLGMKDIRTGKITFDEGVVYELSDDKFIF